VCRRTTPDAHARSQVIPRRKVDSFRWAGLTVATALVRAMLENLHVLMERVPVAADSEEEPDTIRVLRPTPTVSNIPILGPIPQRRDVTTRDFERRATKCEQMGEVARAMEILREGSRQVPNPAPLFNHLALLIARYQRNYREAEQLLRAALRLTRSPLYEQNLYNVLAMATLSTTRARRESRTVTLPG
jgi:hypothetical protein